MSNELYVLEWSNSQKAFHVQKLVNALQTNRQYYAHERSNFNMDWIPMAIGSYAEVNKVADAMEAWPKPKRKKKGAK